MATKVTGGPPRVAALARRGSSGAFPSGELALAAGLAALLLAAPAAAHPGATDAQGCHVCRKKCEELGVLPGVKHCHDGARTTYPGGEKPPPPRPERIDHVLVQQVLDGDTLKVRLDGEKVKVRIEGIDCPESHWNDKCKRAKEGCARQVPLGKAAMKRAAELLKKKTVTLECQRKCSEGMYDRLLRYVRMEDGRDFGLLMIQEGYCADFSASFRHERSTEYLEAQDEAQREKKGMWAVIEPAAPPHPAPAPAPAGSAPAGSAPAGSASAAATPAAPTPAAPAPAPAPPASAR